MAEGVSHARPCLFAWLQPAAQELIRSVLSGLQKPSSMANPRTAGDPGVAERQPPAASPGQPASCLQAPSLAGAGAGGGVGWGWGTPSAGLSLPLASLVTGGSSFCCYEY